MQVFFGILSLLFFGPDPTTYAPAPHGIVRFFGYELGDCLHEQSFEISTLFNLGVNKIEEMDLYFGKNVLDTTYTFYDFHKNNDSLFLIEFTPNPFNKKWDQRDTNVYSKKGSLFYTSSKETKELLSSVKTLKTQSKNREEFDTTTAYGTKKVWRKKIYTYDSLINEKTEATYYLNEPERPKPIKLTIGKDSVSKAKRAIEKATNDSMRAIWENKYRSMKDEYRLDSKVIERVDSVKHTKEMFFIYSDNRERNGREILYYDKYWRVIRLEDISPDGTISLLETTEFIDAPDGRLLSKITYRDGNLRYKEEWLYNKNRQCIQHIENRMIETWQYDAKGIIIEYTQSHDGKLEYKNSFKIYYQ
jgi:hypothetical protein